MGQKQRIGMARGLLPDSRILILGEPTSALDPETEEHPVNALYEAAKDRIVIIIAHRLSTVAVAAHGYATHGYATYMDTPLPSTLAAILVRRSRVPAKRWEAIPQNLLTAISWCYLQTRPNRQNAILIQRVKEV